MKFSKSMKFHKLIFYAIIFLLSSTPFSMIVLCSTHGDTIVFGDRIQLCYSEEIAGAGNYTDDLLEPTGWEFFPAIFWDSNGNAVFEENESIGYAISPCAHFESAGQPYVFWPLHQSVMQTPGDATILDSGWENYPNSFMSKVEDEDQLLTIETTFGISLINSTFQQIINITSTIPSAIADVALILYLGLDINGFFNDYAFIDSSHHNMIKAYDNETGVWFGAYPSLYADNFEVAEWDDGPNEGNDLWQHVLANNLSGNSASYGDVDAAIQFQLGTILPFESRYVTIYFSFGMSEDELYAPTTFPWDVTGDNYVGIDDIVAVAEHFGTSPGHPDWDPKYDINKDDYVGIDDIVSVAEHFGESI